VVCEREETLLGGTAANIARAAARLGVRTRLVSDVGTDFPDSFENQLVADGVDVAGLRRVPGAVTPTAHILEGPGGEQMTLFRPGAMDSGESLPEVDPLLEGISWVHLTTGSPTFQLRIKEAARRRGLRVAVDPAQEVHYRWDRPKMRQLLQGAEILFGNDHEIARVVELVGETSVRALLTRVSLIVVTQGRRGARAYSRTGTARASAVSIRHPNRITGAGDAFRGGFYSAWFGGESLTECLSEGNRSAAEWIRGAGPPRSQRLREGI
jgi:sugar/nucleoside kinase (ribokinase family)